MISALGMMDACGRDVQLRGARVLANLTNPGSTGLSALHQDRLGAAGACEILVGGLWAFPDDRNLVLYACRAAANLCCDHVANQDRLGGANGCPALIQAITKFPADRDIQWCVTRLLPLPLDMRSSPADHWLTVACVLG